MSKRNAGSFVSHVSIETQEATELSDDTSERRMSSVAQAQELLLKVAGPQPGVKRLLLCAHRKLAPHGWTFNRVRDVYHRDKRIKIGADEIETLRALAKQSDDELLGEWRRENQKLQDRIARLEAMLLPSADACRD